MGSQNSKEKGNGRFTAEELKAIELSYKASCGHSDKLNRERLLACWSTIFDPHLVECTANFFYYKGRERLNNVTLLQYGEPLIITERGTLDERVDFILASLDKLNVDAFSLKLLENYVTSVFRTYLNIQAVLPFSEVHTWKNFGYLSTERTILAFSKGLIRSLALSSENFITRSILLNWLQANPIFLIIWTEVFSFLYSKNGVKFLKTHMVGGSQATMSQSDVFLSHSQHSLPQILLPTIEGFERNKLYEPILDIPHVIFINSHLPLEFRHKWRFLFSSKINGESFSTMLGKISNQGPTVVLVEDEDRFIFAGFASRSWALSPNFIGDDTSMLFTLSPAMRCFTTTGYNDHYQYLNINQQTMPNGLGMGGQFNFWALWIDRDFGKGQSSESCTTYRDYIQLSKRKEFRIHKLEVWAVGDIPTTDDDDDDDLGTGKSVLDKNLEDRVLLELAGKNVYSDGLREPGMDDE